jgi:UDPglucose 6-dehydrogenase
VGCDPEAVENFLQHIDDLEIASGPYECVEGADVVMLVTEWNPYRELDLRRIREAMNGSSFVDCRNVYPPERMRDLGFGYECFGR